MCSSLHSKFILSPLSEILESGVNACRGILSGIDTYPLSDYIMVSLFLKMTGAQEQKMKCICWELATNDYEYRYDFINNKNYGECSNFKSKNNIYNDLIDAISKLDPSFDLSVIKGQNNTNSINMIQDITADIQSIFHDSSLCMSLHKQFVFFIYNINILSHTQIWQDKQSNAKTYSLFQSTLHNYYDEIVYKHRNHCAHNTISYQSDLPSLDILANDEYDNQNYFIRFAILMLIDKIFMTLYSKYLDCLEKDKI